MIIKKINDFKITILGVFLLFFASIVLQSNAQNIYTLPEGTLCSQYRHEFLISDPEDHSIESISAVNLPNGLNIALDTDTDDNTIGVVSGTPTGQAKLYDQIQITITDEYGSSGTYDYEMLVNEEQYQIEFVNTIQDPEIVYTQPPGVTVYNQPVVFDAYVKTFPDKDVTYSILNNPDWINIDDNGHIVAYPNDNSQVDNYTIIIKAITTCGSEQTLDFNLEVRANQYCGDGAWQQARETCDASAPVDLSASPPIYNGTAIAPEYSSENRQYDCDSDCKPTGGWCGNSDTTDHPDEECDDGNTDMYDDCVFCKIPVCGDYVLSAGETCDDGNTDNCDGCDSDCQIEKCNNNKIQCNEICDSDSRPCTTPAGYSGTENCNYLCSGYETCFSTQYCGDGSKNGPEKCDEGDATHGAGNTNTPCNVPAPYYKQSCTYCDPSCVKHTNRGPYCGDNIIQDGRPGTTNYGEICDGNSKDCVTGDNYNGHQDCDNSCTGWKSCQADERCGDGEINGNEVCESGDTKEENGDFYGCEDCQWKLFYCGDGDWLPGYEGCDASAPIDPGNNIYNGIAISPEFSSEDRQYSCDSSCNPFGGWCFDEKLQTQYGEECDCGEDGLCNTTPEDSNENNRYTCNKPGQKQYKCKYHETDHWCGDQYLDAEYGEECDLDSHCSHLNNNVCSDITGSRCNCICHPDYLDCGGDRHCECNINDGARKTCVDGICLIPIATCEELQSIGFDERYPLDSHYILENDIDCQNINFDTIRKDGPTYKYYFEGDFNGNNKTIRNIKLVNTSSREGGGIFLEVKNSSIYNFNIENVEVGGDTYVGILSGKVENSEITNINITNAIIHGNQDHATGGLVGKSIDSDITNISINNYEIHGNKYIGGLIGENYNTPLSNVTTNGVIYTDYYNTNHNQSSIGGLIGYNDSSDIINSESTLVCLTDSYNVGGLVGTNINSNISNCSSESIIDALENLGGIVGHHDNGIITNCITSGSISGISNIGGLVGDGNYCEINDSSSNIEVFSIRASIGGLVGEGCRIDNCYSDADVYGGVWEHYLDGAGGLAGGPSSITNSYATGNVTCEVCTAGGLAGGASIKNSYSTGDVNVLSATDINYAGGLAGYSPKIENSFATGIVNGGYSGGLVGYMHIGSVGIFNSYSTGDVSGIRNCGGLIGSYNDLGAYDFSQDNKIVNNYTLSKVVNCKESTGTLENRVCVGGLAGRCNTERDYYSPFNQVNLFVSSFWDEQKTGFENACGYGHTDKCDHSNYTNDSQSFGKSGSQMLSGRSFYESQGWNVYKGSNPDGIWYIESGKYPCHKWYVDKGGSCPTP